MKRIKLSCLMCSLFAGITINSFSQELLSGVTVVSLNYKYIKSVDDTSAAAPVRMLEHRAASYDVTKSEFYEDDTENYFISFYIPDGKILAMYDNKGKLLRTAEKYKNVSLPETVKQSVTTKYPGWKISQDTYLVNYYSESKYPTSKVYKLILENGTKRMRVKTNEKGEIVN